MAHVVYVDLSAKVEHWQTDSAVAVTDGFAATYLIPGPVKQQARHLLLELYGRKSIIYRALALFVYVGVRQHRGRIRQIVIDQDYTGSEVEGTIKNLLLNLVRADRPEVSSGFIQMPHIKGSRADRLARQVFAREVAPTQIVTWREIESLIRRK